MTSSSSSTLAALVATCGVEADGRSSIRVYDPEAGRATLAASRARKAAGEKMVTEKDLQEENGGAGVYSADLRKRYLLEDDDWKYDIVPEIYNGKNVADFIDPEIEAKLAELEREEDELEAKWEAERADREDLSQERPNDLSNS